MIKMPANTANQPRLLDPAIMAGAARGAFVKLSPAQLIRNPVIFTTAVVALLTTVLFIRDLATPPQRW